jgi:superfamily II DNA/RNA helicase
MADEKTRPRACRHPNLLKGIYAMKFQKPSKIQERALPLLLQNPYVSFLFSLAVQVEMFGGDEQQND